MASETLAYADWKAPAEDGGVLVWPEPATLLEQTRENQRRLSSAGDGSPLVQNLPLAELRREQRRWIGHADDEAPLLATGHQIELMHPGVWAKDVLIDELARRTGGSAYHFAVDTDAPKHLHLRWPPGGSIPITDDPGLARADLAGMLEAPTPAHLAEVERETSAAAAAWPFRPVLPRFLDAMRRLLLESSCLTWVLTNATHRLEWELGLRHHSLLASPLWGSAPYLTLAHHLLARADGFAAEYNAALAEHRRAEGITNPGRPWPDLRHDGSSCEAPFWLDGLDDGQRRRAGVRRVGDRWALRLPGGEFPLDPAADAHEAAAALGRFLASNRCRLSPRAMTLTIFLRLLVADQFVHGIGGARYDQVTDRVIARFFGLAPPAFSVTTATLLFPTAAALSRPPVDLRALHEEGRRLRHAAGEAWKRAQAEAIAALPRNSVARRQAYHAMHQRLADRLREGGAWHAFEARMETARRAAREWQSLLDRELFFAFQPEDRLLGLIARYAAM